MNSMFWSKRAGTVSMPPTIQDINTSSSTREAGGRKSTPGIVKHMLGVDATPSGRAGRPVGVSTARTSRQRSGRTTTCRAASCSGGWTPRSCLERRPSSPRRARRLIGNSCTLDSADRRRRGSTTGNCFVRGVCARTAAGERRGCQTPTGMLMLPRIQSRT